MAALRKYPWEEWFGRPRTVLVRGIHYHCSQSTMCGMIRNSASQRGVRVRLTDTGTEIIIEVVGARETGPPLDQSVTTAKGGTQSKYPWDEWFNGDLLLLEKSTDGEKKDFDVSVDAMPGKLKFAARKRYKVCQISRKDADGKKLVDALIIRARDMTPDERVAEDLKRAEEKVADVPSLPLPQARVLQA